MSDTLYQRTDQFETAFQTWLDGARKIVAENYATLPENCRRDLFIGKGHGRYRRILCRLIDDNQSSGAAWAFIDTTNGDVLKPDGYTRPAKHARGNIFDADNGLRWLTWTGPAYLR